MIRLYKKRLSALELVFEKMIRVDERGTTLGLRSTRSMELSAANLEGTR